jgi:hypothetical protein
MLIDRSTKLRFLALIATGVLSLGATTGVRAADCGCEVPCDADPIAVAGCDCGCEAAHGNRFSGCLDKLQDGLKKLCDFKWKPGGGGNLCDDACDAAMMEDLMLPPGEIMHHGHVSPHVHHAPRLPDASIPPEIIHVPPAATDEIAPPVVREKLKTERELFDSLPDPFIDDEARLRTEKVIRPSSHQEIRFRPAPSKPSSTRPLSKSQFTSSRRVNKAR